MTIAGRAIDGNTCVAYLGYNAAPYDYKPSLAAGVIFCVLFGLSCLHHCYVAVRNKRWWQFVLAVGALAEAIGWFGRTWSAVCPYMTTPFLIQIAVLILAPAFFTAATYFILGQLIRTFGLDTSPIGPKWYLYIFCSFDLISLVVQAVGGGSAASAYSQTPIGDTSTGTDIMVAGVLFQLASIAIFVVMFSIVLTRAFRWDVPTVHERKTQIIIAATTFSVVCVVIRSVYRTIELLQGWSGYLITHEAFFIALDGAMMVLAVGIFNISPGYAESGKVKIDEMPETDHREWTELQVDHDGFLLGT